MAEATPPTSPTAVANKLGTAFAPGDLLGGTTVNVGGNPGDLQAKLVASADSTCALTLAGVHRGNTYVCQPGAVYSTVTIPAVSASDTGWTRIRTSGTLPNNGPGQSRVSASHAAQMFKVWSVDGGPTNPAAAALKFLNASRGWIFVGMEATHNSAVTQRSAIFADPTIYNPDGSKTLQVLARLIFDRCIAWPAPGEGGAQGLWAVDVDDLQVWDSWMEGRTINGEDILDSQGIFVRRGHRSHIENNELRATSENLLYGDQDSFGVCEDATALRNHLFKPLTWQKFLADGVSINPSWDDVNWNIKTTFEIKAVTRLLFKGNTVENSWVGQGDQPGDLLTLNGGTQSWGEAVGVDCLIESNKFVNGVNAFAINMQGVGAFPHTRCALLNNLFLAIRGHAWRLGWAGVDIWVEHNTIVPANAVGSNFSNFVNYIETGSLTGKWPRLTIKRNIWGGSQYGVTVIPDPAAGPTSGVWNTYLGIPGTPTGREFAENAELRGTSGSPTSYPGGITVYADAAAAGINLTDGKLTSGPLRNASSESPPKDLGVDHGLLENAMGTPGPPIASFEPLQTMGTRTVVFQDTSV